MDRSQSAQRILAWIFLLGAALQFFLAGLAVFRAKPHGSDKLFESSAFDLHRVLGYALIPVAFALLVLAIVNRQHLRLAAVLFVLMVVQMLLAEAGGDVPALGALHPLNGVALLAIAHVLARARHAEAEAPPPEAESPPPEAPAAARAE
jgi:sulfite exporter TauE/SafE